MSGELKSQRLFSIAELLRKPNMVLETTDDFEEGEEDTEAFGFSRNRNFSSEEMLKYLNIDDSDDEDNDNHDEEADAVKIAPWGTSFEKLKLTMTDISGDGKVFKFVKRAGVGEVVPKDAMVSIHYMGYFEYQDAPFDSSRLRGPSQRFRLNQGSLILGLEMGIQTMKKHEISHFIIHPDYAYGEMGCPPRLPPNEEVMFSVCLLDYIDNAAAETYDKLDQEERKSLVKSLPKATAFHVTANDDFKRNRLHQAIRGYRKVVKILNEIRLESEEEQETQQKALTKALVNLAICYNKLKDPRKACLACKSIPLPNAKAHFTHGKALMSMGEYDPAMQKFNAARKLEPNNYEIVKEVKELNERMMKYKNEERQLWSRCLKTEQKDKELDEYSKAARQICENLINNPDTMRLSLAPGLRDHELDCFKEQAAILGLTFTKHERFGKLEFYISKPRYEGQRVV